MTRPDAAITPLWRVRSDSERAFLKVTRATDVYACPALPQAGIRHFLLHDPSTGWTVASRVYSDPDPHFIPGEPDCIPHRPYRARWWPTLPELLDDAVRHPSDCMPADEPSVLAAVLDLIAEDDPATAAHLAGLIALLDPARASAVTAYRAAHPA